MSSMSTQKFTNGLAGFELRNASAVPELEEALLTFLRPYFWRDDAAPVQFSLMFEPFASLPEEWRDAAGRELAIRDSSAAEFNLRGVQIDIAGAGEQVVVDRRTQTGYHILPGDSQVTFYASRQSIIHLYELVRYTALLAEEGFGAVLLHAAATVHDDRCYLIVGNKGAGKTTTILHLLQDHGHQYFSGDKVLVTRNERGAWFRGWPDYPHLGIGTLRRFPSTAASCGVDLNFADGAPKPDQMKVLIEPRIFRSAVRCGSCRGLGQAAALVFPSVSSTIASARIIPPEERDATLLAGFVEYPHEFKTARWHGLLGSVRRNQRANPRGVLEALCSVPWVAISGPADFGEAARLLRSQPATEPARAVAAV